MFKYNIFGDISANQMVMVVSSVVAFGVALHIKKRNSKMHWRKVGTLSSILCFPIKSCGAIQLQESDCAILGLKRGLLRDRVFMVVDLDGNFVTGRTMPKLTQIKPQLNGSELELKANGMPDISINILDLTNSLLIETSVWGQAVSTVDCGNEVANWVTQFCGPSLRLVYYPSQEPSRAVRPKNMIFDLCTSRDVGALADATSYNLMTESTVADLNTRLEVPVTPAQFRSNFVVHGTKPYEEDEWEWIRIGSTIFSKIKPCTRCLFTTVDPETGLKNLDKEPLETLKKYRKVNDPIILAHTGNSPVLGIHLALQKQGIVRVGDNVYISK